MTKNNCETSEEQYGDPLYLQREGGWVFLDDYSNYYPINVDTYGDYNSEDSEILKNEAINRELTSPRWGSKEDWENLNILIKPNTRFVTLVDKKVTVCNDDDTIEEECCEYCCNILLEIKRTDLLNLLQKMEYESEETVYQFSKLMLDVTSKVSF